MYFVGVLVKGKVENRKEFGSYEEAAQYAEEESKEVDLELWIGSEENEEILFFLNGERGMRNITRNEKYGCNYDRVDCTHTVTGEDLSCEAYCWNCHLAGNSSNLEGEVCSERGKNKPKIQPSWI